MRRDVSKQQQLTRLGIAFVIFVLSSVYYYHRDKINDQNLRSKLGQALKIKTRNDSIIRWCFLIGP
jgi:hypothetical protein